MVAAPTATPPAAFINTGAANAADLEISLGTNSIEEYTTSKKLHHRFHTYGDKLVKRPSGANRWGRDQNRMNRMEVTRQQWVMFRAARKSIVKMVSLHRYFTVGMPELHNTPGSHCVSPVAEEGSRARRAQSSPAVRLLLLRASISVGGPVVSVALSASDKCQGLLTAPSADRGGPDQGWLRPHKNRTVPPAFTFQNHHMALRFAK